MILFVAKSLIFFMAASPTLQVLLNMLWVFIFGWISGAIVGVAPGGDPRPRAGELSTKLGGGSLRLYSQPPFVFAFAFVCVCVCVFVVFVFHPFISISLSFGLVMTWRWIILETWEINWKLVFPLPPRKKFAAPLLYIEHPAQIEHLQSVMTYL